jgi:hypothetical protein
VKGHHQILVIGGAERRAQATRHSLHITGLVLTRCHLITLSEV